MGLGLVLKTEDGTVTVLFPASGETRTYAAASAPLRRVRFSVGDTIELQSGSNIVVTEVLEGDEGLLTYVDGNGAQTEESALGDLMGFHQPDARLLGGRVNAGRKFRLRRRALEGRSDMRGRHVRGLIGARIDLVPHQLFIAEEVATRHAPRVLLADEVGLGKTIEACLIVHRKIVTGRASRVLILVPEPLVHQWFIELMRRFNLKFAIFDEERCASIEAGGSDPESEAEPEVEINPFLDDQLILASVDLLAKSPRRASQAAAAGWDVLVVDEAHHLEWSPGAPSPEYEMVESLSAIVPGLLLLTATPGQLRPEGHFARLRLLDPERFSDLDEFLKEQSDAAEVSAIAQKVDSGGELTKTEAKELKDWLGGDVPTDAKEVLRKLLDLHGTGRVMFRNRRANLGGFPERQALLCPLKPAEGEDPRIDWLIGLLEELDEAKVLLICQTRELAEDLNAALEAKVRVKTALFHEGLDLIQRDRNAAYFAEEEGARLLICSEIGSEGRNFQFAHHLVLFDLPDSPPLLEQRIGRLDRIGQTETIKVHVPFAEDTSHAALARWYHEGLDAFETASEGGTKLLEQFHETMDSTKPSDAAAWDKIIADTKKAKEALDAELEAGRDRLTEMSSFDADGAKDVVEQVHIADIDSSLESLLIDLFDQFGVAVEPLSEHTYYVKPDSVFSSDAFPGMREIGMSITFDRSVAMANETIGFVTWDHPIVTSSIDLLLTGEIGSSSFGQIPGTAAQAGVIVECLYIFESIVPPALGIDRFLPPTIVHAVVDHHGRDITSSLETIKVKDGDRNWLNARLEVLRRMVPPMIDSAEKVGQKDADALRKRAEKQMEKHTAEGIDRLTRLKALGHPVRPEEIAAAEKERNDLREALGKARLRLDSVRLIVVGA